MRTPELVRTIDLFEDLSPADLLELCSVLREKTLYRGQQLCTPDRPYDGMFVVAIGSVEVEIGSGGRARIGPGEAWGDVALISGEPATCSATAVVDSRVLELDRETFDAFVSARPQTMRTILAAISRRAVQANQHLLADDDSARAPKGRVFAVFSTRGGAGKTQLAVRLALEFSRRLQGRAALFDLDPLFDDAALELELSDFRTLAQLHDLEPEYLDKMALPRLIIRHSSGLGVLVGASRPEEGEQLTATDVRAAISELRRQFSVTVMDCANTYSEPLLAALESADRILVVCTPEFTTLRDVRELQRLFGQALHLGKERLSFVLNHPSPATGLSREQFERGLEERMLVEIEHAGERAMRPEFARTMSKLADELDPASTPQTRGIHFPSLRRAHG